jgi:hypothetical protein
MRMMMTVTLPIEKTNIGVRDGKLMAAVQKMLSEMKPEAAYFGVDGSGCRSGMVVFEMTQSSEMPKLAEPWFLGFNAAVTFRPVMTPQDLAAAGPDLERAAKSL